MQQILVPFSNFHTVGVVRKIQLAQATGGLGSPDVAVVEEEVRRFREAEEVVQEVDFGVDEGLKWEQEVMLVVLE